MRSLMILTLLAARIGTAATTPLQLGINYSEWLDYPATTTVQLIDGC